MASRTSAPWRVFHIPELLGLILDDLEDGGLARMARVAKSAHVPSIQRLWVSIRDLENLTGLFPPGLVVEVSEHGDLAFSRHPIEPDWTRFKHYSNHVTSLHFWVPSFSPGFFLHFINVNDKIFPHLEDLSLQWPPAASYPNSEWLALAPKTLQVLDIRPSADSFAAPSASNIVALSTLLQQLPLRTPDLYALILPSILADNSHTQQMTLLVSSFLSTITSLPQLTKLTWTWGSLPTEIIGSIIRHPRLNHVKLQAVETLLETNPICLPALIRLSLLSSTEEAVASWLSGLARPDLLEEVELRLEPGPLTTQIPLIPPFISPLSKATNLTTIVIHFRGKKAISWIFFEPLLGCKCIGTFDLTVRWAMEDFNDEALETLAKSWRVLESIEISTSGGNPAVTFYGLKPMALYCSKLYSIKLDILLFDDTTTFNLWQEQELNSTGSVGNLDKLELFCCQTITQSPEEYRPGDCVNPRRTAQVIRSIWPALKPESIELNSGDHDDVRRNALNQHLKYVRDFIVEIDLRNQQARGRDERERLLEGIIIQLVESKDQLVEERVRLDQERDALIRKCARLEEILRARPDIVMKDN